MQRPRRIDRVMLAAALLVLVTVVYTATASAQAAPRACGITNWINLRSEPELDRYSGMSNVVGTLMEDECYTVVGWRETFDDEHPEWVQLDWRPGQTAWVFSELVVFDPREVMTPVPTPTQEVVFGEVVVRRGCVTDIRYSDERYSVFVERCGDGR